MWKSKTLILLFASFVLVAGCSSKKQVFSVDKQSYDPFTIYSYPSLALPPIYYLSSQEISDERRFIRNRSQAVQNILYGDMVLPKGNSNTVGTNLTQGDRQFLKLAGSDTDMSNIKVKLNEESLNLTTKSSKFRLNVNANNDGESLSDSLSQYIKLNNR